MLMTLVAVGNIGFALASLIFGIRLCLLARRTGQLPELLLGIGFLAGGFLGHTLAAVVYGYKPAEPWLTILQHTLRAGAALACGLLFVMAQQVFRREERWAKALLAIFLPVLATYVVRDFTLGRGGSELMRHPLYWVYSVALWLPYVWLTVESFNYQQRLRRQRAIGLPADMVLAMQMKFWAIGMGSMGAMLISLDAIRLANLIAGRMLMDPRAIISAFGLNCTIFLWLAFFPPAALLRRVEAADAARPAA